MTLANVTRLIGALSFGPKGCGFNPWAISLSLFLTLKAMKKN